MSSVPIQENHKCNLKILHDQPIEVLSDFCKLAINFLTKGTNVKLYQAVSQKLNLNVSQVQSAVEGLVFLFVQAYQNELNDESFQELSVRFGFQNESAEVLYNKYTLCKDLLCKVLPNTSVTYPHYSNLEWRFETQISSKSLRNEIIPRVLLKLKLEKGQKMESFCIQSDIPNVLHMSQVLNRALLESRTNHSRKVQRAVI